MKSLQELLQVIIQLQEMVLEQQKQIDSLREYSGRTAEVVNSNGTSALNNDKALLRRIKEVETVVTGILQRESSLLLDQVCKADNQKMN